MPVKARPAEERFWSKVHKTEDCWLWMGARDKRGYGYFGAGDSRATRKSVMAHRFAYESVVGPIPEGLTLDHLCKTTSCVRPDHLEPCTRGENVLRGAGFAAVNAIKTHCPQGHEYTEENTYRYDLKNKQGQKNAELRYCKKCRNNHAARSILKRPEKYQKSQVQWAKRRLHN